MSWACAVCGSLSKTNRRGCRKCGSMRWKPSPKRDIGEVAGPMKRIAPRGLLLARSGRQAPVQDSGNGIECGTCHTVIYRPEGVFDKEAFAEARKRHYAISPACENDEHGSRKDAGPNQSGR